MRPWLCVAALITLFGALTPRAVAAPPTSLDVTAQHVNFYSNRFIVTADGNVRVRLSDGTVITGDTFTMDLKLNRYLVAGGVQLDAATAHENGAALAGYPDLDRTYFLPEGIVPERWTFYGTNWTDRHVGREQPGDAFNFPNLTGERAYIVAKGARITPRTNVLFTLPLIYTAGVYLPQPRYVVTFSANSHYFENAFAGARLDVGLPFNGSEHSLSAFHIRNDPVNGTYLAFDQHLVWQQDWVAFGIDPLTQQSRQYNLVAYKRWSPRIETHLFTQVTAAQAGLISEASNSAGFGQLQVNAALKRSFLSYTQDNYYNYLQGLPYGIKDLSQNVGEYYDARWRHHAMDATLAWVGFENRAVKGYVPVMFRLRSGLGLGHDQYGYIGYPGDPVRPDAWYHYVGGTVYTPPIALPGRLAFNASYDKQRNWFNIARYTDQEETRLSLSGARETAHVRYFLAYDVKHIGDYWGNKQFIYTPGSDTVTTSFGTFSGQKAWRGIGTSRGWTGSLVYTPTQFFEFNTTLSRFYDFPAPVPGAYGQPPWQLTTDLRIRLAKQILLDLSRQYYFNFANERWTPQFGIQFSP